MIKIVTIKLSYQFELFELMVGSRTNSGRLRCERDVKD